MNMLFLFIFTVSSFLSYSQKLSGTWQGIRVRSDSLLPKPMNESWIYLDVTVIKGMIDGKMRHEDMRTNEYYVTDLVGKVLANGHIEISEIKTSQKSINASIPPREQFQFEYNIKTGYLIGENRRSGHEEASSLTLYRASFNILEKTTNILTKNQLEVFKRELLEGLSSPEKRKEELKAFRFDSIYFDYGKDTVKRQYEAYLIEMIRMVKSHSDLRILVTGHTDSDGSDAYNKDLSQRRAAALEYFFESHGLAKTRVEIDFKGEKEPIYQNDTPEGRQKNRRVDFRFI